MHRVASGAVLFLLLLSPTLHAGTVSTAWDPVSHPNLVGYRVYYGTTSGSYPQWQDVGLSTQAVVSGLADCTTYFVAVKARASDSSESVLFSNEIVGWARPELSGVSPSTVERGTQLDLTISGTNFQSGLAVNFADAGITVNSVNVASCNQIVVNVSVGGATALGPGDFEVVNPDQVFGAGSGLFTVNADSSAPTISATQSSGVADTSATISWTTDEPTDGQVMFRKTGETQFQATSIDPTLTTSHSVVLTGLEPSTNYEYYAQSTDGSGNTATSAVQSLVTQSNAYVYLRVEAEAVPINSPHQTATGAGAFQAEWLELAAGSPTGSAGNPTGTTDIGFHVPASGTWHVWLRMFGPSVTADSWFESVDGGGFQSVLTTTTGVWEWVPARSYTLSAGLHVLTLGGREAESRVDRILVTDDPNFLPSEQPGADSSAPQAASGFTAASDDGAVALAWVNPGDADLARIVVRYATDGSYPQSPIDGLPLVDTSAGPGASGSHDHTGLVNGTTYRYGIFAVDASGNVSDSATTEATPNVNVPPLGQVPNLRRTDIASGP